MKSKIVKKKKVYVGMSGGVDSSVTALLLKQEGYEVTGVFIKVWQPDFIECTWREDRQDAMRVCAELEIPFLTLDLEKVYKEGVIDYMLREYQAGQTPNPDVFCNKEVKFGAFLTWAIAQGADYIATGHYARIKNGSLVRGRDQAKDQSYFLWTLNSEQLKKVLFPVGNFLKRELRGLAEKSKLFTAEKKDSQGLCFIGKIDVKDFLKTYIQNKVGKIIDFESREVLGEHTGIFFYTLGEKIKNRFIVQKDIEKNILYVALTLEKKSKAKILLEEINFTKSLQVGETYLIQERYHAEEKKIKILSLKEETKKRKLTISYKLVSKNNFIYTEGQSLVFYKGQTLYGGGIMR